MEAAVYDNIVKGIYSAGSGLGDWRLPLGEIAREFALWGAQIIGVDKRSGTLLFSFEGCGPLTDPTVLSNSALDYLRTYHASNPRLLPSMQLKLGSWMHCHELFDETYVAKSAFYQDFLIPYGGRYLSGTKLVDDENFFVFFGAMRGVNAQPLSHAEMEDLTRLRTQMVNAFGIYLRLRDVHSHAGVGRLLLDTFRYPCLLIDQYQTVIYMNQLAMGLIAGTDHLIYRGTRNENGGTLYCLNSSDNARLLEALRYLGLNDPQSITRPDRTFFRFATSPDRRDLIVFLSAIRPEEVMRSFGHQPLALLMFHEPSIERKFDPFIIGEIFGLTPAEAKVAVYVAKGLNPEEISSNFGVSLSTIRTQLKSIFSKTGTTRQSELALMIMNLPEQP